MQDYTNYTIKDFILDDSFCRWVLRNASEDAVFWENWIHEHPQHAEVVADACDLIKKVRDAQDNLSENELREELKRLTKSRKEMDASQVAVKTTPKLSLAWLWKVAAILVVSIAGLVFYLSKNTSLPFGNYSAYQQRVESKKDLFQEVLNDDKTPKVVTLPDGSKIILKMGSRVSFLKVFSEKHRDVYLSGEAFFDVVKDPTKPFVVYANELATKVLGTSFTISSYEKDKEVKVIVKTGRVSVFSLNKEQEPAEQLLTEEAQLILTPNQQVVFNRDENRLKRSLVAIPEPIKPISSVHKSLIFDRTPISQVFDSLEEIYGISMTYDNELLLKCQLTAELEKGTLFEKLDLICKAIEARYELIDGQVVVYGKRCN
ncbi:FecR family protein [Arcicella lustrica]|uniref:FecR domain-containing protein n=1 Tax=Arcicella lustrica TaxID=2984196 RepID=A0ABU5SJE4_9BACT|nr:FecR domain-containing protein [Arcicella sp. DC25W]MEA5427337.1 FecR domain-containing protein [Arcicella sp. DC25W]